MVNADDSRLNQEMRPFADNHESGEAAPDSYNVTSPIRPEHPEPPKPKVTPSLARPVVPQAPISPSASQPSVAEPDRQDLSPTEKARLALENLREKMTAVVQEYAEGRINQAQFNAIYRRYAEQREITERLLERNPQSGAWKSVVQPGHTGFLRDHFEAKILSYGLYKIDSGDQIILQGQLRLPIQQLKPIFARLRDMQITEGRIAAPIRRKLKDGNWVLLVSGRFTASVVIFSLEPATVQRQRVEEIQRDFERANEKLIVRGDFDPARLVFPHRALFE